MASKFTIVRDTRERTPYQFRASANCEEVVDRKLDVGDYTLDGFEDVLAVERKTLADLWNTLAANKNYERFLREWERGKGIRLKYLVIEASLDDLRKRNRYTKVHPNNIMAKLFSLQVKHDVHVIFAGSRKSAHTFVRDLFAKIHKYRQDGVV